MKKYLMIGIAAVAMTAAFTSCSKDKDFEQISQVQLDESKYQAAFESRFGTIAPNHDWGFNQFKKGANARMMTRATTYMNGNMEKYYDAPAVGATEETDVEAYVHALTALPAKDAPDWETYFVTHIHGGTASYNTQNSVDNTNTYVAGNQMDELAFAMQAGAVIKDDGTLEGDWIHINNFNSADNTDWGGNTLVENGGTVDFAYKSTVDSKYHNRWIGIDGADIDKKYKDYYYICFDFEATNPEAYTNFRFKVDGTEYTAKVSGAWTVESATAAGLTITVSKTEWVWDQPYSVGHNETTEFEVTVGGAGTSNWSIDNVVGGNKVVEGNNDYTDWIVRLYKAKAKGDGDDNLPKGDVRVIVEDMKAADEWDGVQFKGDFDFNDVVFDVVYDYDNTQSAIILQAAGGTLPLYLTYAPSNFSVEVHDAFGEYGTGEMINTGAGPNEAPKLLPLGAKIENADLIVVTVEVPSAAAPVELKAERGRAPHKIAVPTSFNWMTEWKDIETDYPGFSAWVNDPSVRWYK